MARRRRGGWWRGGWRVIGAARRAERLAELAAELGPAFLPLTLDVNDPARTGRLIENLPEAWLEIEVLINNAGGDVGGRVRFDEGDVEDWTGTIEVNVNGVIRVTRAVVPGMLARGWGQIVIVSSLSGVEPFADDGAYIAAKAGAHGLAQALRHDYAATAIKVTEILPGTARTEFATARWRGDAAKADAFYDAFPRSAGRGEYRPGHPLRHRPARERNHHRSPHGADPALVPPPSSPRNPFG